MTTRRLSLFGTFLGTALALALMGGCSVGDERRENLGKQLLADPLGCPTPQFQQACDPDGAGTQFSECEGLCVSSTDSPSGQIVCQPIAALGVPNLAGYLCGSGPRCTETCTTGGTCMSATAADHVPCNPNNANNKCGSECLSGICTDVPDVEECPFARDNLASCVFHSCQPLNARVCVDAPLPGNVTCTGGNLCDGCGVCNGPATCGGAGGGGAGGRGGAGAGGASAGLGGASSGAGGVNAGAGGASAGFGGTSSGAGGVNAGAGGASAGIGGIGGAGGASSGTAGAGATSGAAGSTAGGAGRPSGGAGAGGNAGASTGGAGDQGGAGGEAGAAGEGGGQAGGAGAPSGGTSSGGSGGATGGTATGGFAGEAGEGTGGSGIGGTAGRGGGGSGGSAGKGGSKPPRGIVVEGGGCDCRQARGAPRAPSAWFALALASALFRRRRVRQRCSSFGANH